MAAPINRSLVLLFRLDLAQPLIGQTETRKGHPGPAYELHARPPPTPADLFPHAHLA